MGHLIVRQGDSRKIEIGIKLKDCKCASYNDKANLTTYN
jgi:hypothetical protein